MDNLLFLQFMQQSDSKDLKPWSRRWKSNNTSNDSTSP